MKYSILLVTLITTNVFAGSFQAEALVLDVTPRYTEQKFPKQVCETVQVPVKVTYPGEVVQRKTDTGRLIFNTAVGAAIGNQFGSGKGKDAATIFGGLVGMGMTDDNVVRKPSTTVTEYRNMEQCRTVYETKQVQDGYIVKYNYNGYISEKYSPVYPGSTIDVIVNVGE